MSPSLRDRLQVALCPDRLILVRLGAGLRPRVKAKAIIPCQPSPEDPGPPWQPALSALQGALEDVRWRKAEVRVVLSNHFVRYLVEPWDANLKDEEERAGLVRFHFTQIYGEAAADWDFRWHIGRPPAPCLASAVDSHLLAGLRQACKAAGVRLASIQPYLMAAFNAWRRQIRPDQDWFLLAEEGRLCLAWFQDKEWAGVSSRPIGPEWGEELPDILARTLLLAGRRQAPGRLCIHAPEIAPSRLVLGGAWSGNVLKPHALPGFEPARDGAYAMALNS